MGRLLLILFYLLPCIAMAGTPVIQIIANFREITGQPQWTLILRDVDTGKIEPLILDIRNKNSAWTLAAPSRNYRITVSHVSFGEAGGEIANFCHLQNHLFTGKSMIITLSGQLVHRSTAYRCHVQKYD